MDMSPGDRFPTIAAYRSPGRMTQFCSAIGSLEAATNSGIMPDARYRQAKFTILHIVADSWDAMRKTFPEQQRLTPEVAQWVAGFPRADGLTAFVRRLRRHLLVAPPDAKLSMVRGTKSNHWSR